jgi:two-component system, chemotaxis family, chemotaxis protein CheY
MKRCMIVDDSSVIRKVAKRILASPTMTVAEASSGAQALAHCEAELPDIIIVDNVLGDMSVVMFIQQVMAIDPARPPRIVVSMTQLDIAAVMRAKRAGAKGYVLKPFNRPQLLERFRDMDLAA